MTEKEMYEALDAAKFEYEVVEIFEGVRFVRIEVEEEEVNEDQSE